MGHPQFPVEVELKEQKEEEEEEGEEEKKCQRQKSPVAALLGLLPNERRK